MSSRDKKAEEIIEETMQGIFNDLNRSKSMVGAVVDGCPAGLPLAQEDIQQFLDRRKPGQSRFTTARSEADRAEILSCIILIYL